MPGHIPGITCQFAEEVSAPAEEVRSENILQMIEDDRIHRDVVEPGAVRLKAIDRIGIEITPFTLHPFQHIVEVSSILIGLSRRVGRERHHIALLVVAFDLLLGEPERCIIHDWLEAQITRVFGRGRVNGGRSYNRRVL